ncbi:MAG TPA: cation-translocating P-type ATPase [Polyangia bacterium]|nr:cation-translocating P-type ATPase [Polyangia bacterium]
MTAVGLASAEALLRLQRLGANEIRREQATSRWALAAAQMKSPLVWLLLGACLVAGLLGELADAIAIGVIVVINAVVGFFQESRAERAILALRAMTAPRARVLRDGRQSMIAAAEVVVGDVLWLEAGDVVAADGRLIEANLLSTNEAPLTGESLPVGKSAADDRGDGDGGGGGGGLVYMGTSVSTGTGLAEVTATGMATQLGKIAHLIQTATDEPTPLQRRLAKVGTVLLVLCLFIVVLTAVLGFLRGQALLGVFVSAISLAVAAVPEGLPAIVTIALAIGVQRMAARHVLVRKLPAVETLGSATVICTDKTGTLTTGVMSVRELWGVDHDALVRAAVACCDAELGEGGRGGAGDPTELAILAEGFDRGLRRERVEAEAPRRAVIPFDAGRRRMAVFRADGVLYVKGAFESLQPLCLPGTDAAAAATAEMANRGYRVLAVATGQGGEEKDLRLVGLIGLADPPRTEAVEAVAAARAAGIRTVMITGDHPQTAAAIAREMGIVRPGDDPALLVHARATPEEKLNIVRQWKAEGAVVAMTGDGVNDAPALREAHVGIAMGRTGTEVTREASDLVLADDNFASIIAAVREGRGIFDNIRKTLVYLLAGNTGELLVMLGAALLALPLPLLPLHLLWINLVTDGMPALALVMDPSSEDVMRRPPRTPSEPMLGRREWVNIGATGVLQATVTLGVFWWRLGQGDVAAARTLAFSTLVFGELFRAFASRSSTRVLWEVGAFSNLRLIVVIGASVLVQIGVQVIGPMQRLFRLAELSPGDLLLAFGLGLLPVTLLELAKFAARMRLPLASEVRS